jgi:predicted helicase
VFSTPSYVERFRNTLSKYFPKVPILDSLEYVEKVRLDKENREITINGKVKVRGIPKFAFECKVGNYPPIEWISKYLVRKEDRDTGIVWDPRIKVEEFVDIVKKLVAFFGTCLEIKEKVGEAYEVGSQIRIVVADISTSTV